MYRVIYCCNLRQTRSAQRHCCRAEPSLGGARSQVQLCTLQSDCSTRLDALYVHIAGRQSMRVIVRPTTPTNNNRDRSSGDVIATRDDATPICPQTQCTVASNGLGQGGHSPGPRVPGHKNFKNNFAVTVKILGHLYIKHYRRNFQQICRFWAVNCAKLR